jgi:hypothetical protein
VQTWQIIAVTVLTGLGAGWLLARTSAAQYRGSMGTAVGTDPTLNFVVGPVTQ